MLYNKLSPQQLTDRLLQEDFRRITISFYRYFKIDDPETYRNELYRKFSQLYCLGRIYVASEGINAQISVPEHLIEKFSEVLNGIHGLENLRLNYTSKNKEISFYKLKIKVRNKIVADGIEDPTFNPENTGKFLNAIEFHKLIDNPEVVIVDMRNNYESEIGRFRNAICPDAVTFREEIKMVTEMLDNHKEDKILLYCTGGIRCEKAGAYLKHQGFKDVNQLNGGIIEYVNTIRKLNLPSKFIGKNFVFDNRMAEKITDDVISFCHQCGKPCDTHVNCANDLCHLLFIQCKECSGKYHGCCSDECVEMISDADYRTVHVFKGKKWRKRNSDNLVSGTSVRATGVLSESSNKPFWKY